MNGSLGSPLVYLVLGPLGSGRRALIADLIEGGGAPDERAAVLLAGSEASTDLDVRLGEIAQVGRWTWAAPAIIAAEAPRDVSHLFFVTAGEADPIDQIEAFQIWLAAQNLEIGRVITVVDCRRAELNPQLLAWFDGCIHFSDVVLLAHREGVANKWLSDFQTRYKDQAYPCLFELVRDSRVRNPALVLEPRALRLSHIFDEADWTIVGEDSGDEPNAPDGEEEVEVALAVDPYFARLNGGRRVKELPDITRYVKR